MNRLADATSPYLRQHQHNPVDWWPWGEPAFAEAQRTNRPVLLSVGYAACHWCHVMAHESFEDPETAAVMNALFVNIKVDREERPDVDHVYMSALHALGEQGGWPLTMFLTPDRHPFWGGTYFPRAARYGRPAFIAVLNEIARVFSEEPHRIGNNTQLLATALADSSPAGGASTSDSTLARADLDRIGAYLVQAFDPVDGGLSGAPKFPNPTMLEYLWRHADRTGDSHAMAQFLHTLERMIRGGIHDHLGGGFARYAVDTRWLVPHFEKMLYDNAQLLELIALAAVQTGQAIYVDAAEGIVAWLEREMLTEDGAFAASLDADSEGEEGRFYVWAEEEIADALGPGATLFARHYDVTAGGNWEGHVILNRLDTPDPDPAAARHLAQMRAVLLRERGKRVRPGRDDKVLADWNGLMIAALARAGTALARPHWIALAQRAFRFIAESMSDGDRLAHSARAGKLLFPGFATDHASMARAALALSEATADSAMLVQARQWIGVLERDYADPATGILYMTSAGATDLVVRPNPTNDDAVPNGNGLFAEARVRLAMLSGAAYNRDRADAILQSLAKAARTAPLAHASILNALDLRLRGAAIVVTGESPDDPLRKAARAVPYPNRTVARSADLADDHPAGSASSTTGIALVCAGEQCSLPVTDPVSLTETVTAMTRH